MACPVGELLPVVFVTRPRKRRGGFIVAHHSGAAQGRGVDRNSRDLCLDGLGKKKARDEKKQGKMRLCERNPAKKDSRRVAYLCMLASLE